MPWWDGLAPDMLRELRHRNPELSLEDIGIAAVRRPEYAAEFERLDVTVWTYKPNTSNSSAVIGYDALYADDPDELQYPERNAAAVQALIVAAALDGAGSKAKKPRHRPPDPIPVETAKQMKWELAQRKSRPRDPEFTQEKIAAKLDLDRSRVQQAEALEQVGWDLLRSHPEFSANDGLVRWPSAKEAARMLVSGRAEN